MVLYNKRTRDAGVEYIFQHNNFGHKFSLGNSITSFTKVQLKQLVFTIYVLLQLSELKLSPNCLVWFGLLQFDVILLSVIHGAIYLICQSVFVFSNIPSILIYVRKCFSSRFNFFQERKSQKKTIPKLIKFI